MKHFIVLLLSSFSFIGCCYEVDCKQENINFGLIGFLPADADTIIFRRYEVNSNFRSLKDTMEITNINLLYPRMLGDTIEFLNFHETTYIKFLLVAGYDYEIFFPGVNKLTRVTAISEKKTKGRACFVSDGNQRCYNPIIGYKVDGQLKTKAPFFIHK